MQKSKNLVTIGGILLLIGAALPWATVTSYTLGLTQSINGYQTDGLFSGLAGLIILLIGLNAKPKPGEQFSAFTVLLSIVAGAIIAWKAMNLAVLVTSEDIRTSLGFGLSCLSPLGALLAFFGGIAKTPAAPTPVEEAPPAS